MQFTLELPHSLHLDAVFVVTATVDSVHGGIATQRPELVSRIDSDVGAENIANLIHAWTLELSELMVQQVLTV